MPRDPVVGAMDPRPGEVLADIGAGLGWLSVPLAEHVGPEGHIWAIEPSGDAVEELNRMAQIQELPQLQAIEAFAEKLPLDEASVDGILWHTVALMMGDRRQALAESFRVLRPGGRLVVVDWKVEATAMGPPAERRVAIETLTGEALARGFSVTSSFAPGPVTWGRKFLKPKP
jgi:ubiquinone/menaquinone biosynthesis C-methylase UbiE